MLQKAIEWIQRNHLNSSSMPVTHKQRRSYPEVTGYFIPTLLSIGEITLAEQFARWLVSVQNANGSFSLDDTSICYAFDTGQVIRGWVSIIDRLPELANPLQRACDWIINSADPATGRFMCPAPSGDWSLGSRGEVSEGIHLYVIKPMRDAAKILKKPYIQAAADKALAYYLKHVPVTDFSRSNALTHFYGYMQEALFELGCLDEVTRGMAAVAKYQRDNGAVPAYHDVHWICSTGLAQLAKVWYLLNDVARADAAMAFLAQFQNESGGFYGSYGLDANYFPADEIPWAVKYAIEAEHLRIARHFDQTAHQYATTISAQDGRVQAIFAELGQANRVLDAGCGKGRYAALIKQHLPHAEIHAVDVSEEMLRHVPQGIQIQKASIQDLPYPDDSFDLVYCVEALEHAPNPEAALNEMIRVLTPGGRLVIIDKNAARQGALKIEAWERWFDVDTLTKQLQLSNLKVRTKFVSYDGRPADGLFVSWIGTKYASTPLHAPTTNVNFYRTEYFNELNRQLVDASQRGDKEWIKAHLRSQDSTQGELFPDELFENRVGMQLIQQLLLTSSAQFDIADIACGNATLLRRLRMDGHRVQGVDVSQVRVNNNSDLVMQEGFCEELPLSDQSADVVIALECMEHVYDLDMALRECVRVLRMGGIFLCQVPLENFADGCNHVRLFNAERLRLAVSGVGLEVFNVWQIPYLVGEPSHNLFVIAKRPGSISHAAEKVWPILSHLANTRNEAVN